MAGKAKYAERLAKHLNAQVDAACMINRAGSAKTMAIGGVIGAAATAAVRRGATDTGEINVPGNAWLGLGPNGFVLVRSDNLRGFPKGDAFAEIGYAEVASVELEKKMQTTRADIGLADGRTFAFETRRTGLNKPNVEVLELLAQRCAAVLA